MGKTVVAIQFLNADLAFIPKKKQVLRQWIFDVAQLHRCNIDQIDYIFCSDAFLLNINRQFLNHDTFTDIITFDYGVSSGKYQKTIAGEIYISIDRIKENAKKFNTEFTNELHRVMIHGVLHLCGFKDKKSADRQLMRSMEEEALGMLQKM